MILPYVRQPNPTLEFAARGCTAHVRERSWHGKPARISVTPCGEDIDSIALPQQCAGTRVERYPILMHVVAQCMSKSFYEILRAMRLLDALAGALAGALAKAFAGALAFA